MDVGAGVATGGGKEGLSGSRRHFSVQRMATSCRSSFVSWLHQNCWRTIFIEGGCVGVVNNDHVDGDDFCTNVVSFLQWILVYLFPNHVVFFMPKLKSGTPADFSVLFSMPMELKGLMKRMTTEL